MDTLPLEILSKVISCLDTSPTKNHGTQGLASYALVCKEWQGTVERLIFNCISVKSTELDTFTAIFDGRSNNHRRGALQNLTLTIILPSRDNQSWHTLPRALRRTEKQRNNMAFSEAFKSLFETLNSWPDDIALVKPIALHNRQIYSLPHVPSRPKYPRSELKIISPESLPAVKRIGRLNVNHKNARLVQPGSLALLASCMPNLWKLDWYLTENYVPLNSVRRRQHRYGFAKSLKLLNTCSLRDISITSPSPHPQDHTVEAPSILTSHSDQDYLSQSFRHLFQIPDLRSVMLLGHVCISPELFWPSDFSTAAIPYWPNLTRFRLEFSPVAPEGGWYYVSKPNFMPEDDDDEPVDQELLDDYTFLAHDPGYVEEETLARETNFSDDSTEPPTHSDISDAGPSTEEPPRFRIWPSEKLDRLILAMARAVSRMPAIELFVINTRMPRVSPGYMGMMVPRHGFRYFEIQYCKPGERSNRDHEHADIAKPRLYILSPTTWRMSEEVERLWMEFLGGEGIIEYDEW